MGSADRSKASLLNIICLMLLNDVTSVACVMTLVTLARTQNVRTRQRATISDHLTESQT